MYSYNNVPKRVFGYNPKIDLHPVDPNGEVNLRKAYANGIIEGTVAFDDNAFNGIQDPDVIMDRPKDSFERIRQGKYVKESLMAAKANAEAGQPQAAAK